MSEELKKSAKELEIRRFSGVVGEIQAEVDTRQGRYKFYFLLAPLVGAGVELAIALGLYLRPHGMGLLYALPVVAIAAYHWTRLVPIRNVLSEAKEELAALKGVALWEKEES